MFSKKVILELVGAGLELLGGIGAVIGIFAGVMPDKKEDNVKEISTNGQNEQCKQSI